MLLPWGMQHQHQTALVMWHSHCLRKGFDADSFIALSWILPLLPISLHAGIARCAVSQPCRLRLPVRSPAFPVSFKLSQFSDTDWSLVSSFPTEESLTFHHPPVPLDDSCCFRRRRPLVCTTWRLDTPPFPGRITSEWRLAWRSLSWCFHRVVSSEDALRSSWLDSCWLGPLEESLFGQLEADPRARIIC